MKARLEADRGHITAFVEAMFKHAPAGTFISLRAFFDKGEHREGTAYWPFLALPVDDLKHVIQRAGDCATWAANRKERIVFCPPIAVFRSRDNGRADNLAAVLAISVEIDHTPAEALTLLIGLLGKPTLVVVSGGVDIDHETGEVHDRLHLHWLLAQPAMTEAEIAIAVLARRLACALVGGDASGTSPVHPFRWPGSWHRKGEPRLAFIREMNDVEVDLDQAYAALYHAADARGLIEPQRPSGAANVAPDLQARSIDDVAMWLHHIPNPLEPDNWHTWNNVLMAIWGATAGSAEGLELALRWSGKHPAYRGEQHQRYAAARWRHFDKHPPKRIGAGRLYFLFNKFFVGTGNDAGDADYEGSAP